MHQTMEGPFVLQGSRSEHGPAKAFLSLSSFYFPSLSFFLSLPFPLFLSLSSFPFLPFPFFLTLSFPCLIFPFSLSLFFFPFSFFLSLPFSSFLSPSLSLSFPFSPWTRNDGGGRFCSGQWVSYGLVIVRCRDSVQQEDNSTQVVSHLISHLPFFLFFFSSFLVF